MVSASSLSPSSQALGLFLGGLVAVGGAIMGLALGPTAWALSLPVVGLAVWHLWRSTPRPHRYWQWLALVPGCALGMVAGLLLALQVSSQERLLLVVESTGFEVTMMALFEKADCSLVNEVLATDLDLLPQRPALAGQVRWEMWDEAAKHGCVSGEGLAQARVRLRSHAESAPMSIGMDRQVLLRRLGPSEL